MGAHRGGSSAASPTMPRSTPSGETASAGPSIPCRSRRERLSCSVISKGCRIARSAQVLNCPIGTVMSRLHNARRKAAGAPRPDARRAARPGRHPGRGCGGGSADDPLRRPRAPGFLVSPATAVPASPGQRQAAPASPVPSRTPEAETDERLRAILPRLRTLFRYTDYTTLDRQRAEGPLGTLQRFTLPGPRQLEVTPDQLQGNLRSGCGCGLLRDDQPGAPHGHRRGPGAPAVLGGPSSRRRRAHHHSLGQPQPHGPVTMSEERYFRERARIEQGHLKYRDKLRGRGQALRS